MTKFRRVCEACDKELKNTSAYNRHQSKCRVLVKDYPRSKPRRASPNPSDLPPPEATPIPSMDWEFDIVGLRQVETIGPTLPMHPAQAAEDVTVGFDVAYGQDEDESDAGSPMNSNMSEMTDFSVASDPEALGSNNQSLPVGIQDGDNIIEATEPSRRSNSISSDKAAPSMLSVPGIGHKRLLSTSSCVREETFTQGTKGRRAGCGVDPDQVDFDTIICGDSAQHGDKEKGEFFPFLNAHEYALAQWFREEKITKGGRHRFFNDPRLEPVHRLLSFKNTDQLLDREGNIPFGIEDDGWTRDVISIQSNIEGTASKEYTLLYRGIIKALRFLLGHRPFKEDMVFAPVRQYNNNDKRVYTDIYTGDWWWQTQEKLPDGATVVPLLLSTDKTALTRYKGDLAAWPVYLTIGNLKADVRRSQKRPGLILLGLLPIVPNDGEYVKSNVWHMSMAKILERKSITNFI